MKQSLITILLLIPFLNASSQNGVKANDLPLTMAIRDMASVLDNKIPEQVKVVGIGNIYPLAKESTDLSMTIAQALICQQKFRHVILFCDDWMLRPISEYITDKRAFDSTTVDSLVRISMANSTSRTAAFGSFIIWLKKYNVAHPEAPVELSGMVPDELISPAYFLATYIFPVDKASGLIFSKKWRVDVPEDESAAKDIAAWYQKISKNTTLFNKHKALLLRCAEDIAHNDIIQEGSSAKMPSRMIVDLKIHAMARFILKKTDKRTIVYGNNEDIATAYFLSQGDTLVSLGKVLQEQLKDKYYTCLTDFADTSNLTQIDPQTGQLAKTMIPGSMQCREWFGKKITLFIPEDSDALKHYLPRTIFPILGIDREISPDKNMPATNALFIIKSLTPATFLKRIIDIGDWVK